MAFENLKGLKNLANINLRAKKIDLYFEWIHFHADTDRVNTMNTDYYIQLKKADSLFPKQR